MRCVAAFDLIIVSRVLSFDVRSHGQDMPFDHPVKLRRQHDLDVRTLNQILSFKGMPMQKFDLYTTIMRGGGFTTCLYSYTTMRWDRMIDQTTTESECIDVD